MITNVVQYAATKRQAENLRKALDEFETKPGADPMLEELERAGIESVLEDLERELREFEAIRDGVRDVVRIESVAEIGRGLIAARIASGMSQQQLARKLGVTQQSLQRQEAREYTTVSLGRLGQIAEALGVDASCYFNLASSK